MTHENTALSDKAQHTRLHILDTALALFVANGYEATTMREIASAAECSLGLTYRYFASKEALILALYWQMAAETGAQIEHLPSGTLADRFYNLMVSRLDQATRHRESFRVLFSATMNPNSGVSVFGSDTGDLHQHVRAGFRPLIKGASEAPAAVMVEDLATILYSLHFAVILFWLYDRSPNQRATAALLVFIRDLLKLARYGFALPIVRQELARAARIANALFVAE